MKNEKLLVFVSDNTGVAAETLGLTIMTQMGDYCKAKNETLPFIRTIEESIKQAKIINGWKSDYLEIVVFSTFVNKEIRESFEKILEVNYFDFFDLVLPQVSKKLKKEILPIIGSQNNDKKEIRAEAIDYALSFDDGQNLNYDDSDIILLGLSRSGKTPTAMWLALHYGLKAANYPITDDDFENNTLPINLNKNIHKCVLLIQTPQRLSQIRQERYKNSNYASIENCKNELNKLFKIPKINDLPKVDVSNKSVEEIVANALMLTNIHPKGRF